MRSVHQLVAFAGPLHTSCPRRVLLGKTILVMLLPGVNESAGWANHAGSIVYKIDDM